MLYTKPPKTLHFSQEKDRAKVYITKSSRVYPCYLRCFRKQTTKHHHSAIHELLASLQ